jgi:regulator of protease activity HflC (stomatin/prohibitin superfamily)
MTVATGIFFGLVAWFVVRYILTSFYTVDQNERAVKTVFGRAERVGSEKTGTSSLGETLSEEDRGRYNYPLVQVIQPGGPYFKWPWERI